MITMPKWQNIWTVTWTRIRNPTLNIDYIPIVRSPIQGTVVFPPVLQGLIVDWVVSQSNRLPESHCHRDMSDMVTRVFNVLSAGASFNGCVFLRIKPKLGSPYFFKKKCSQQYKANIREIINLKTNFLGSYKNWDNFTN